MFSKISQSVEVHGAMWPGFDSEEMVKTMLDSPLVGQDQRLYSLHCFDTDGLVAARTCGSSGLSINPFTNPRHWVRSTLAESKG